MNDKQIKAFIRSKELGRKAAGDGLYIRVQTEGVAYWEVRYSVNGKRRSMMLSGGLYPAMPLVEARAEAAKIKLQAMQGVDPLAQRARLQEESINTVNDLFDDFYKSLITRLKHHEIPLRNYTKEIKPTIGQLKLADVNPRDIKLIITEVAKSARPTVSNKVLLFCKQLFNHGIKLGLITSNPAIAFKTIDAGGVETSRERALSIEDVEIAFKVLRDNNHIFTRDNYLAVALLISLGVRKGELIAAKWAEFDFEKQLWDMPKSRSKTGRGIVIPLPDATVTWFKELYARSGGSEYVFPNRRASKRRGYISSDTLNHALAKLFGQKVDGNKEPYDNLFGQAGIEHFTIHDLRRTCRTLLAALGVIRDTAELCLNHKIKGVEGIYNKFLYLEERRIALCKVSNLLTPMINGDSNITPFIKRA
jgi:integrase